MHLGPLDSFITRRIFRRLVRSAYTESELRSFISETGFQSASIRADEIGFEVWLRIAARIGRHNCGLAKLVWNTGLSNHFVI
jgi:hypothetical protein